MTDSVQICNPLLWLYRERFGSPAFWAEPMNAITNGSFLIAAVFAMHLAMSRRALTPMTLALISIAGVIGCGSFLFHTIPTRLTMWLDIIPISLFQTLFLWLVSREMFSLNRLASAGVVICVVGASFALMPVHEVFNGSLFYIPSLGAMLTFGVLWARRSSAEPYVLLGATYCFLVAIIARSFDWGVPWPFGTHFVWHLLNGVVVYLVLRVWVLSICDEARIAKSGYTLG